MFLFLSLMTFWLQQLIFLFCMYFCSQTMFKSSSWIKFNIVHNQRCNWLKAWIWFLQKCLKKVYILLHYLLPSEQLHIWRIPVFHFHMLWLSDIGEKVRIFFKIYTFFIMCCFVLLISFRKLFLALHNLFWSCVALFL